MGTPREDPMMYAVSLGRATSTVAISKKKCFSNALGYTLVVLEVL